MWPFRTQCPTIAASEPCAGREVLRMYARLRGVAIDSREALAGRLLQRLGLARYADRCAAAAMHASQRVLIIYYMRSRHGKR